MRFRGRSETRFRGVVLRTSGPQKSKCRHLFDPLPPMYGVSGITPEQGTKRKDGINDGIDELTRL
jgi:hypothetical protein